MRLDKKDKQILIELQENSKQRVNKIAKKLGIPITTVHHRIKKLEKEGVIMKYTTLLDPGRVGAGSIAMVLVNIGNIKELQEGKKVWSTESIAESIAKLPGVSEVHGITGRYDIIVKIRGENDRIIGQEISKLIKDHTGVTRTETCFAIYTAKESLQIDL